MGNVNQSGFVARYYLRRLAWQMRNKPGKARDDWRRYAFADTVGINLVFPACGVANALVGSIFPWLVSHHVSVASVTLALYVIAVMGIAVGWRFIRAIVDRLPSPFDLAARFATDRDDLLLGVQKFFSMAFAGAIGPLIGAGVAALIW